MKTNTIGRLSMICIAMAFVACSEYDNGYTSQEIKFRTDFEREIGTFDPQHDWNMAERTTVNVLMDGSKDVMIYEERDGVVKQVGHYSNVDGQQKLAVDVERGTQYLIVYDGDHALRTVKNGTVDFVDMMAYGGEVLVTRAVDDKHNMYQANYGDILPGNITSEEQAKVLDYFKEKHENAYNTQVLQWDNLFVQQVYRDSENGTPAFMNQLVMYNKNGGAWIVELNGKYDHVDNFNAGSNGYESISESGPYGMTYMYNMDWSGVPKETVTGADGQSVEWVKQFAYHNSTDSRYHAEYLIMEMNGSYYIGFDFYANGLNANEQVARDWIFNDWIIKVTKGKDAVVPPEEVIDAPSVSWILAGEDLGGGFDVDYNDVVVKVEYLSGEKKAKITPMAAGGTLADYLFFDQTCVGEIHQLMGAEKAVSGSYTPMNVEGTAFVYTNTKEIDVPADFSLSCDISIDNNMGHFKIHVLPFGSPAMDKEPTAAELAKVEQTVVKAPMPNSAPYIICVPYSYTLLNTPSVGKKTIKVWEWPVELQHIDGAYNKFSGWAKDRNTNQDWYMYPNSGRTVKTDKWVIGNQVQDMTAEEKGEDPNAQPVTPATADMEGFVKLTPTKVNDKDVFALDDLINLCGDKQQLELKVEGNNWGAVKVFAFQNDVNWNTMVEQTGTNTQLILNKSKLEDWKTNGYSYLWMQNPFTSVYAKAK